MVEPIDLEVIYRLGQVPHSISVEDLYEGFGGQEQEVLESVIASIHRLAGDDQRIVEIADGAIGLTLAGRMCARVLAGA